MIGDLRPDLNRNSVEDYIDSLVTELDKLESAYYTDGGMGSLERAEATRIIKEYVRLTKFYPNEIPEEEYEEPVVSD